LKRFEAMNLVTERVYVIPTLEGDEGLHKRCHVGNQAETRKSNLAAEPQVQIRVGEVVQPCGADVLQADVAQTLEEADAIVERNPIQVLEFSKYEEILLQLTLLPTDVLENYKQCAEKLRRELESLNFADHKWDLKTYDHHGVAVVKIFCRECKRRLGVWAMITPKWPCRTCFQFSRRVIYIQLSISSSGARRGRSCTTTAQIRRASSTNP
jgi:hypothetical protein